jgi:hypothetical protein
VEDFEARLQLPRNDGDLLFPPLPHNLLNPQSSLHHSNSIIMGEHKYSVLDVVEANETTSHPVVTATAVVENLASPVATAPPDYMEDIPNLVTTNPVDSMPSNETSTNPQVASGVASGILGCLLGGPLLGLALGLGASYAHSRPGAVGDASRAVGDLGVLASRKAQEYNQKHSVASTTKKAASRVLERAQEYDRNHEVVQSAQNILVRGWNWTVSFVHRHNLLERGVQTIGQKVVWVAETIASKINSMAEQPHDDPQMHHPAEARVVPDNATK